jgi:deazaflavin-dependent oxidoreductase (nitroreductase family)
VQRRRGSHLSDAAPAQLDDEAFCYLTTRGRVTGRPHVIEIWFAHDGSTLFLLAGGGMRSDWVRNVRVTPDVTVRVGETTYAASARVVTEAAEDRRARDLVFAKYQQRYGGDLRGWREHALPVALDLLTTVGEAPDRPAQS